MRTRHGRVELEVWFRIVHLGQNKPILASNPEQTIEVALGPNRVFEGGNMGLKLRAPPSRVKNAAPPSKPPKQPKTPRVVELLRKAAEWKVLLDSGKVATQAEIACQEGMIRARVTQIMGLLRLAPEIREKILSLPDTLHPPPMTERMLRPIAISKNTGQ